MSREQQTPPPPRRFIAIPFSSGCRSHSSVDVVATARHAGNGKKPHSQGAHETGAVRGGTSATPPASGAAAKGESLVARLLRGFKNLSHQIFAVYDEDDDDEEEEKEMVIGLPTDVKHVAHIGWDGSTSTTSSLRSWNRAAPPPPASSSSSAAAAPPQQQQQRPQEQYPLPLPALSMRQFELAMAAQAAAGGGATTTSAGGAAAHRRHS